MSTRSTPLRFRHICLLVIICSIQTPGVVCAEESYFPIKSLTVDSGLDAPAADWYGKILARMAEPKLPDLATNKGLVIYRFTIIPTWGNPVSVRVQQEGKALKLWAKSLSGKRHHDQDKLTEQKERILSEKDSKEFLQTLSALSFFKMPTEEDERGLDGDEWILEGVKEGRYHVVVRWCANSYKTKERGLAGFVKTCEFLMQNAGLSEFPKSKGREIIKRKVD